MIGRCQDGIRVTHIPTGITAKSAGCAPGRSAGNRMAWHREKAVSLLLARLNRPAQTQIRRTYDLFPPLGIPPNIQQDGRWIARTSDEVQAFLAGRCDFPTVEPPANSRETTPT